MQYLASKEGHPQTNLAAPTVKAVALHRSCHHEEDLRWRCLDVTVKRRAVCNTDHRMLWVKLRIGRKILKHIAARMDTQRYDVVKLQGPCVDMEGRVLIKGKFVEGVCESMKQNWDQATSAQEKWDIMKSASL